MDCLDEIGQPVVFSDASMLSCSLSPATSWQRTGSIASKPLRLASWMRLVMTAWMLRRHADVPVLSQYSGQPSIFAPS